MRWIDGHVPGIIITKIKLTLFCTCKTMSYDMEKEVYAMDTATTTTTITIRLPEEMKESLQEL